MPERSDFRFARTPHWREIADLAVDPLVKEIWAYKCNQIGFTLLRTFTILLPAA